MSEQATTQQAMAGARDGEHAPAPSPGEPRRTLVRRVLGRTVARWGARLGLMWIVVLVIAAVFAPLIANTHPLLMKAGGQWSSPLLRHLGAGDVVLLVMFFAGLGFLLVPKARIQDRVLAWGGVTVWAWLLLYWPTLIWSTLTYTIPALLMFIVSATGSVIGVFAVGLITLLIAGMVAFLLWMVLISHLWRWILMGALVVITLPLALLPSWGWFAATVAWGWIVEVLTFLSEGWPSIATRVVLGTGIALLVLGWSIHRRVGIIFASMAIVWVVGLSSTFMAVTVEPPSAIVYSEYREGLAAGEIERVIHAPIPYSPQDRLRDQPDSRLEAPDGNHLMGTTNQGADLAANMIYASRIALSIGFISTGIALFIGIIVGGVMGYFSGVVDLFGMRFVEIISAIPTLFLLLALVAVIPPEYDAYRLYLMMVLIGLTSWVGYALFIRAEFLRLRQQEFVEAAQALGLPLRSILFRHMLPNGVAPVLVAASFGVAGAILAESTLSFLGIGLIGEASWGNLLNQALGVGGSFYWWIALYPGLAIFLTVFAYNLIGEALRDAIDPRLQGSNG